MILKQLLEILHDIEDNYGGNIPVELQTYDEYIAILPEDIEVEFDLTSDIVADVKRVTICAIH